MSPFHRLLLIFLLFTMGFVYARTIKCPRRQLIFAVLFSASLVFADFIVKNSTLALIFAAVALLFASELFEKIQILQRKNRDLANLNPFLLKVILALKIGHAFRETFREEARNESDSFRKMIAQMLFAVENDEKFLASAPQFDEFFVIFKHLDREPAKIVTHLEIFRKKIDCEMQFRAKVAQILSQPRAQGVVISLLYISLLGFLSINFKSSDWLPSLYVSAPIFFVGQVVLFTIGRSFKWKV